MRILNPLLPILFLGITFSPGEAISKIKVVTTTDLKYLTEVIGGDKVEVESIMRGYQDPHSVDPKPSHMIKLSKADMFVRVGLDMELWSQLLIEGARNPKINPGAPGHVDASQGVELLEIPVGQVDRSLGDIHLFGNPPLLAGSGERQGHRREYPPGLNPRLPRGCRIFQEKQGGLRKES